MVTPGAVISQLCGFLSADTSAGFSGFGSLLQHRAVDLLPVFDFQLYCSRDDVAESESRRGFYLSSGKVGILAKEKKKPGRKEGRKERRDDRKRGWTGFYQVSINSSFCLHLSVFTQSPRCLSPKVVLIKDRSRRCSPNLAYESVAADL